MELAAQRIRAGLYQVVGAVCQCGGAIRLDKSGRRGEFLWETFCVQCHSADPNGWPTLSEAMREGVAYLTGSDTGKE